MRNETTAFLTATAQKKARLPEREVRTASQVGKMEEEMEEKKLTDEEIVKVLDECFAKVGEASCGGCKVYTGKGLRDCMRNVGRQSLDLIHRLQAENQKQYEDYCLLEVENLNIRQENENLRIDNDDLRERNENFYEIGLNENTARFEDMKKIERLEDEVKRLAKVEMEFIGKIADQKAEIKQLTEVRDDFRQEVITLNIEKLELQKQVDELKEENEKAYEIERANIQAEIAEAGTSCHWCKAKTEKDTAKEILQELYDQIDENTPKWVGEQIKIIAKRKGVEVE